MADESMRLMVRGPLKFDDYSLVKKTLNKLTFSADDVVLISDLRIDHETKMSPSTFPLAEKWLSYRWKKFAVRGENKSRYSVIIRHFAPFEGDKQWSKGLKKKHLDMIKDSTRLVVFWDVGSNDYETEEIVKLAKIHDLLITRILV